MSAADAEYGDYDQPLRSGLKRGFSTERSSVNMGQFGESVASGGESMSDTKLAAARGEHWVCSLLAAHGWSPALTRDGVERTDVLAAHPDEAAPISVQVKSASFRKNLTWLINSKAQQLERNESEWFVFVAFAVEPDGRNRCFVMPRNHVAAAAWISHMTWMTDPDAKRARKTGLEQARLSPADLGGYEDRWDLLLLPTSKVPVLLSQRLKTAGESGVGYPPGHPWKNEPPDWFPPAEGQQ